MDYRPYDQMMNYYMPNSPMMGNPTEKLEDMYPEVYYRIYPKIKQICMLKDTADNKEMYPYPSRSTVERMVDDIYRDTMMEMGETEDDQEQMEEQRQVLPYGYAYPGYTFPVYAPPVYGFGGRRRFLRDLVGVLLLRELLGRRGYYYY
ncbi:MAG: hypothetical protein N3I35_09890 [Clostridia bacterium]|nr:hypothetical protein [Clostridia bacterium]